MWKKKRGWGYERATLEWNDAQVSQGASIKKQKQNKNGMRKKKK